MDVGDNTDVEALSTLLKAEEVSIGVCIYEAVDEEGWNILARAVQEFESELKTLTRVFVTLAGAVGVKREDIEAVWEATSGDFMVWRRDWDLSAEGTTQHGQVGVEAETWEDLEDILDMTEDELKARYREDLEQILGYSLDESD